MDSTNKDFLIDEYGTLERYKGTATSVSIPEGVTEIGFMAFRGCTSLVSVSIPEGVTAIDDWAFMSCTSLVSVSIPESVTDIGWSAFAGCTVARITA